MILIVFFFKYSDEHTLLFLTQTVFKGAAGQSGKVEKKNNNERKKENKREGGGVTVKSLKEEKGWCLHP